MAKKSTEKTLVPSVPNNNESVPSVPKNESSEEATPNVEKSNFLDYSTKVRSMSIQCYCGPSHWGTLLDEAYRYAYIYHDKDVNDDGTPKTPHYHIVVRFSSPRYRSAVEKMFDLEGLTEDTTINFQKVRNLGSIYSYLTHKSASSTNKHQYDENDVVTNDLAYFNTIGEYVSSDGDKETGDYNLNSTFLEDLTADNFNLHAMCLRYGRDFMKNYARYIQLRNELLQESYHVHRVKLKEERIAELGEKLGNPTVDASKDSVDVAYIGRYFIDNILSDNDLECGSVNWQLDNFLTAIKEYVKTTVDRY